jgi:peptidoglycan hydrolase-like protein with peptidoglycan-binding domain
MAGTISWPKCPEGGCTAGLVNMASLFGDDERRTEAEYARDHKFSLKEVRKRYAASGAIICKGFGERRSRRSVLYASGQLTGRSNIVTTTAHTIIDKNARLMGRLENCVFETRVNGRTVSSPLTSDYIAGFKDDRDSHFAGFDWAVIRLRDELPVEPYGINDNLQPLFGWLEVANVVKVANFNFDNWGKSRARVKSIADCVIKPETVAWSTGVRGLRTDCDIAPGNSGGAVLSEVSGKPMLIGIMVGTTATSFKTRKEFDLQNDYNIGALMEGEFLQAVRDMSSMMSVKDIQTALNDLGYESGPPDGVAGSRTRSAIRAFEKANRLDETGAVSLSLSLAIGRALAENPEGAGEEMAFEAGSDAFVGGLYQWRAASLIRSAANRPDWLDRDPKSNDVAGPLSAWASSRLRGCRNVLACLEAYGAPTQALRAAYALEKTGLIGTYVRSFTEYGAVDLVSVGYPYNTGGLIEYALVNGKPEAVAMRDGDVLKLNISDRAYQQLGREYDTISIQLIPRFEAYRLMPDGGQRFVFAYPVTPGCQICDPLGQVLIAHEFSAGGEYRGLRMLAYADADEELQRQVRRTFSADDLAGDDALVQRRLNGLGYEAGPVDGVAGRMTRSALEAFQADHGLPVTGELNETTAALMSSDGVERHLRRLEALLLAGSEGARTFGLGLLGRFQQLPGNSRVQFAALANNVAGEFYRAGRSGEALDHLQRAEAVALLIQAAHPQLYEAIVLNRASVNLAMDRHGAAGEAADEVAGLIGARVPDFALATRAAGSIPDPERAAEQIAVLREYLASAGPDGNVQGISMKPIALPHGEGAYLFTLQSPFATAGKKS